MQTPANHAELRQIDRAAHAVLVVNDDAASRYANARMLRQAGFQTIEAATGEQGLEAAGEGVSAIVLDVHLPDIDGFEVCRRLRATPATARIPVIHLSAAYVSDEHKVRGLDVGADAYLTHPVEPAVLVATVQALVRARVAEDAMRRSEAKFKSIYARAPGGICLLDGEGRFLDANPAMLKFLQRPMHAVVGRPVADFVLHEDRERVLRATRNPDAEELREEFSLVDVSGNRVPLEWSISPHAELGVSMAQATDISQRVLLEQERRQMLDRERDARTAAEHLNRMKDEFIAVLSHELRSPLNAIMGWAHVLIRRGGSEEAMKGLTAIERNGKLQARLISDLLDMSRMNIGKMNLSRAEVDPLEVIESAITALGPAAQDHDNEVVLSVHKPYPPINADAARLQQVVWNLLSNAVKFSPRHARIDVSLSGDSGGVRIAVKDAGQGIGPDFLPHIFERFTQADSSNKRNRGGLGLGLSIVQHLVQAHGGKVEVQSEGVGFGATFEVWLPAAGTAAAESATMPLSDAEHEAPLQGMRLLVVEDDPEAAAMLQIILSDRGAKVTAVLNYDDALTMLELVPPDAMVSDIGLPGMNGYELMREVRRREALDPRRKRLPAIALTSFSQTQDKTAALEAGFDIYCSKPVRPLHLIEYIRQLVRPESPHEEA